MTDSRFVESPTNFADGASPFLNVFQWLFSQWIRETNAHQVWKIQTSVKNVVCALLSLTLIKTQERIREKKKCGRNVYRVDVCQQDTVRIS